jgi:hypothetical protein
MLTGGGRLFIDDFVFVLFNKILELILLLFMSELFKVVVEVVEEGSREVSREDSGLMSGVVGSACPSALVFNILVSFSSEIVLLLSSWFAFNVLLSSEESERITVELSRPIEGRIGEEGGGREGM